MIRAGVLVAGGALMLPLGVPADTTAEKFWRSGADRTRPACWKRPSLRLNGANRRTFAGRWRFRAAGRHRLSSGETNYSFWRRFPPAARERPRTLRREPLGHATCISSSWLPSIGRPERCSGSASPALVDEELFLRG